MSMEQITYRLRFPLAQRHLVEIEAIIPTVDRQSSRQSTELDRTPRLKLIMPLWTPGSYLIREYARNIESIAAFDGETHEPLLIRKIDKNSWIVEGFRSETIRVVYALYCREMSVRTNWIDEEFALINGAATFLTRDDAMDVPHIVEIEPIALWPYIASSMPASDGSQGDELSTCFTRRAGTFHELVDSPILLGDIAIHTFEVSEKKHFLAHLGNQPGWDLPRAVEDCQKIVAQQHGFWKDIPYPSYWFINIAAEGRGGLEHDNNTVLLTDRWTMAKPDSYLEWLGLVSHEFFHTWNVRRLRPRPLQEYDYQQEQYLEELWIAEGITSYFDDLFVLRAGLSTPEAYLGQLNKTINTVEDAPGKLVQSLRDSSWDTWIKHYRPDENTQNSRISYYTKGAVVAFLLDAKLRELSGSQKSLDDVMRHLWNSYRATGYTLADFEHVVTSQVAWDWKPWFEEHIFRAEQLNYQPAYDWLGLERVQGNSVEVEIGCEFVSRDGRWMVTKVIRDAPGSMSGLQVDDELIAVEGWRLPKDNWRDRLQQLKGQSLTCTVARRGQLKEVSVLPRKRTNNTLRFTEHATYDQHVNRRSWLYSGATVPVPSSPYFD